VGLGAGERPSVGRHDARCRNDDAMRLDQSGARFTR
jgi:hypothetical protein